MIEVVSRDRNGGYGEAAAKALPQALQVADRWHSFENASGAFLDAVRTFASRHTRYRPIGFSPAAAENVDRSSYGLI